MSLRIGDILSFPNSGNLYEVLDIDTSRPPAFILEGKEFRQDVLFKNPERVGCVGSWAGSLQDLNERIEHGGLVIINRPGINPRLCGLKKFNL